MTTDNDVHAVVATFTEAELMHLTDALLNHEFILIGTINSIVAQMLAARDARTGCGSSTWQSCRQLTIRDATKRRKRPSHRAAADATPGRGISHCR